MPISFTTESRSISWAIWETERFRPDESRQRIPIWSGWRYPVKTVPVRSSKRHLQDRQSVL